MEYRTVLQTQPEFLDRDVNKFLAMGFELSGDVKLVDTKDGYRLVQTLVRKVQGGKRKTRRN